MLQHHGQNDILQGGVDSGEHAGGQLRLRAPEGGVGCFAEVGDVAVEDERGLGALAHDRQQDVEEILRVDSGGHVCCQPAASW